MEHGVSIALLMLEEFLLLLQHITQMLVAELNADLSMAGGAGSRLRLTSGDTKHS